MIKYLVANTGDEVLNTKLYNLFVQHNYAVILCNNSSIALIQIEQIDAKAVFITKKTPTVGNVEFLKKLRLIPRLKEVAVIYLSYEDDPIKIHQEKQKKVSSIVYWPFEDFKLIETVEAAKKTNNNERKIR